MSAWPLLPGFHRQARVVRPFRHRGVVEPDIGMAEHDEGERVGARGDAAAAIGDDPRLVEGADRGELGAQRWGWEEGAALGIDQPGGGYVDALRDAPDPAINGAARAGVLRPAQ